MLDAVLGALVGVLAAFVHEGALRWLVPRSARRTQALAVLLTAPLRVVVVALLLFSTTRIGTTALVAALAAFAATRLALTAAEARR